MEGKLTVEEGELSYRHVPGLKDMNVLFLHGTLSDKNASKSLFLQEFCAKEGLSYTAFDFMGHGESSGLYTDGTIGRWLQNALDIIDRVTRGPLMIVGSSMGGWIMLLAALARPERVKTLTGLAAAPDFTVNLWAEFSEKQKKEVQEKGIIYTPNGWTEEGDPWTRELFEDARDHLLLTGDALNIVCPVTLIHGTKDDCVPLETSFKVMNALKSDNVKLIVLKNSGHRLSEPHELDVLADTLRGSLREVPEA